MSDDSKDALRRENCDLKADIQRLEDINSRISMSHIPDAADDSSRPDEVVYDCVIICKNNHPCSSVVSKFRELTFLASGNNSHYVHGLLGKIVPNEGRIYMEVEPITKTALMRILTVDMQLSGVEILTFPVDLNGCAVDWVHSLVPALDPQIAVGPLRRRRTLGGSDRFEQAAVITRFGVADLEKWGGVIPDVVVPIALRTRDDSIRSLKLALAHATEEADPVTSRAVRELKSVVMAKNDMKTKYTKLENELQSVKSEIAEREKKIIELEMLLNADQLTAYDRLEKRARTSEQLAGSTQAKNKGLVVQLAV